MATDLLGPNDWGKLPPEQLWNVLKVMLQLAVIVMDGASYG
jgi:hypothetical protein